MQKNNMQPDKQKPRALLSLIFIWAFVFSSLVPSFGILNAPVIQNKDVTELQKIFGSNFLICTNSNDSGESKINFSEHKSKPHKRHCPLCISVFANLAEQIALTQIPAAGAIFSEFVNTQNIFLLTENVTKYTQAQAPPAALLQA
jgi:hypothetical protein